MEKKNKKEERLSIINKRKDKWQLQIWVEELKSWLVFDNFKSKKMAQDFLKDKAETKEREAYILRTLKSKNI